MEHITTDDDLSFVEDFSAANVVAVLGILAGMIVLALLFFR
jgi:hypothetical protein